MPVCPCVSHLFLFPYCQSKRILWEHRLLVLRSSQGLVKLAWRTWKSKLPRLNRVCSDCSLDQFIPLSVSSIQTPSRQYWRHQVVMTIITIVTPWNWHSISMFSLYYGSTMSFPLRAIYDISWFCNEHMAFPSHVSFGFLCSITIYRALFFPVSWTEWRGSGIHGKQGNGPKRRSCQGLYRAICAQCFRLPPGQHKDDLENVRYIKNPSEFFSFYGSELCFDSLKIKTFKISAPLLSAFPSSHPMLIEFS